MSNPENIIVLTKEQEDFLEIHAAYFHDGEYYFHIPHTFKKVPGGYQIVDMPEEFKKQLDDIG